MDAPASQEKALAQLSKRARQRLRKKQKEEKKKKPLVPLGTLLQNKYELVEVIGSGGYGQILKAKDVTRPDTDLLAVKITLDDHEPQRMVLEMNVLMRFRGHPHIPKVYASGNCETYMFIVMEMLGRNLSDLRKNRPMNRFHELTALRVGMQMLNPLQFMHDSNWLHRDVKPANICIGNKPSTLKTVFLVDFGMARELKVDKDGKLKMRSTAGFRGTVRYASLNVHDKKDQTATDDLVSLFYSIIELGEGKLPWSRPKDRKEVVDMKRKPDPITCRMSVHLMKFYTSLLDNPTPHRPNYSQLEEILKKCLPADINECTKPFEWEFTERTADATTTGTFGSKTTKEHEMLSR